MIPFNKPSITEKEKEMVMDAINSGHLSGDGKYTFKVYEEFKKHMSINHMLLTTSGTTALEMASLLLDLKDGDEVIVPSFTFSSTVNAFMLRGAKPVFCDIRRDTFNINEELVEGLITKNTKAIYTVDYAGFPCEYDTIKKIAFDNNLMIIEDAAQAVGSTYKGHFCGTFGTFGCFSFHETKNYAMGEGGALIINEEKYIPRAEIIREKGTNRRDVLLGNVDKYTWHDIGSSFLPSDILAAILYAQLLRYDEIFIKRMRIWDYYFEELAPLDRKGLIRIPIVPENITHNAHMFNIVLSSKSVRSDLISHLKYKGINAFICYVPLHSSPFGIKLGYTPERCPVTEEYGETVLRLPLYADMTCEEAKTIIKEIKEFFKVL